MPRIYVDLDDVLAQTGHMLLDLLERQFGRQVDFDSMRSFHLGESLGLDESDLAAFMDQAHEAEALATLVPMPGAIEALRAWDSRGYEVWVVTGRPPETYDATLDWLDAHAVPRAEFHFLDKYSRFYDRSDAPPGTLTLDDLPALDFCLAIEDFAGMAQHLADDLGIPVALFDRPWNRDLENPPAALVRCDGWPEIRTRFPRP